MSRKVKMVLYIWKKLKEELDELVSLYEREGKSLKKTEVVSEALSKEVIKRKLEFLSQNLSVLRDVDLDCLASKLYKVRLKTSCLSEEQMAAFTGRISPLVHSTRIKDEEIKEIKRIAELLRLPYAKEKWDSDSVVFLVLKAIEDCKKVRKETEEILAKYLW